MTAGKTGTSCIILDHIQIKGESIMLKKALWEKSLALTVFLSSSCSAAFAKSLTGGQDIQWPWTKFFTSLANQLTGPLPMTLGAMGIAGAAITLFAGHAGGGTQKFIVLILAISICLFAPNFMDFISDSAGGLTITAAMQP